MEDRNVLTVKQSLTFFTVLFLVCIHIADEYLPIYYKNLDLSKPTYGYYYLGYTYILLAILILIHKNDLSTVHVDSIFLVIFIITGLLFLWAVWGSVLSLFIAVTVVIVFESFRRKKTLFYLLGTGKTIAYSLLAIIPYGVYGYILSLRLEEKELPAIINLVLQSLIQVIFWELVFRGAIWSLLEIRKLDKFKLFILQLLFFWCVFILRPNYQFSFYLLIPLIIGLWHSFLVLRANSITPAVIAYSIFSMYLLG